MLGNTTKLSLFSGAYRASVILSREAPKLGMETHTAPPAVGGGGSKTTSQSRLYRKALSQEPNSQPVNSKHSGNLLMIRKTMEKKSNTGRDI